MHTDAPKPTVLIIDDEPAILRTLERLFTKAGWTVRTSPAPLAHADGYDHVDVVLSDLNTPDGGGWRVKEESSAPVVIYSATAHEDDHQFLVHKPAPFEVIVAELERAMAERQAPTQPEQLTGQDLAKMVEQVASAPFGAVR